MSEHDWIEQALCAEVDPAIFFPHVGDAQQSRRAKAVCLACPVRLACLEAALALPEHEDFGIWGALSERDRRKVRRLRKAAA